jgi:arginine/serine-rich splicing factor 4/5/6
MGDTNVSDAANASMHRNIEGQDTAEGRNYDNTAAASSSANEDSLVGSAHMRPVFLGNLIPNYSTDRVTQLFENPRDLRLDYDTVPVDRIDVKRGYCFVFLKDAKSEADKMRIEKFVGEISGM